MHSIIYIQLKIRNFWIFPCFRNTIPNSRLNKRIELKPSKYLTLHKPIFWKVCVLKPVVDNVINEWSKVQYLWKINNLLCYQSDLFSCKCVWISYKNAFSSVWIALWQAFQEIYHRQCHVLPHTGINYKICLLLCTFFSQLTTGHIFHVSEECTINQVTEDKLLCLKAKKPN